MSPSASSGQALPLGHLKVLEFGHLIAGPTAALILGDLGADVVKLEPIDGDSMRRGSGSSSIYFFNRNKRSIAVDLRTAEGRDIFLKLAARCDVVIENYGPGALERLELGFEQLRSVNPRLILCSVKGFLPGPYYHRRSMDEIAQMMGGLAFMTGVPGKPQRAGTSVSDSTAGTFGAVAILAALLERERTGQGQYITSGLYESVVFLIGQYMARHQETGEPPQPLPVNPMGPRFNWAIYDLFDCKDGKSVFIGLPTDRDWQSFCRSFGLEELLEDPRLATIPGRIEARDWLLDRIQEAVIRFARDEAMAKLEELQLPFGPYNSPADLLDDAQMQVEGRLLPHEAGGKVLKLPSLPIESSSYRIQVHRSAPGVGEHSVDVLRELGYTQAEMDSLVERKVVGVLSAPMAASRWAAVTGR